MWCQVSSRLEKRGAVESRNKPMEVGLAISGSTDLEIPTLGEERRGFCRRHWKNPEATTTTWSVWTPYLGPHMVRKGFPHGGGASCKLTLTTMTSMAAAAKQRGQEEVE